MKTRGGTGSTGRLFVVAAAIGGLLGALFGAAASASGTGVATATAGGKNLVVLDRPYGIEGAFVDAAGKVESTFVIARASTSSGFPPAAATDGTDHLVVWQQYRFDGTCGFSDLFGATVSGGGAVSPSFPIAAGECEPPTGTLLEPDAYAPDVDFDGSNYFVVWSSHRVGGPAVMGARVTAEGEVLDPNGMPIALAPESGVIARPRLASDGVNFLVTYAVYDRLVFGRVKRGIYATRVSTETALVALDPAGIPIARDTDDAGNVVFDGETWLVVWADGSLQAARVSPAGVVLDPVPVLLPVGAAGGSDVPAVAFDGTNTLIAWRSFSSSKIVAVSSGLTEGIQVVSTPVATPLDEPDAAVADGHFLVVGDYPYDQYSGVRVSSSGALLDSVPFPIASNDTTPPDTTITSAPAPNETTASATFAFAATEPNPIFSCHLDGSPLGSCASPLTLPAVPNGTHTFEVAAIDASGNIDPSPALWRWTVNAPVPDVMWANDSTPTPAGAAWSSLASVSCASAVVCAAVGSWSETSFGGTKPLVQMWDGRQWTLQAVPPELAGWLARVSCATTTYCVAVGSRPSGTGTAAIAMKWDGTQWTALPPPPARHLAGVSCSSTVSCVAVGSINGTSTLNQWHGAAFEWNGSRWIPQAVPSAMANTRSELLDVSCAADGRCAAVGQHSWGVEWFPLVLTSVGSLWQDWSSSATGVMRDVSCGSAQGCVAIGDRSAMSFDGLGWTSSSLAGSLADVSCVAPDACVAVAGDYWAKWNGSAWTFLPKAAGDVAELSCPSEDDCVAVGATTAAHLVPAADVTPPETTIVTAPATLTNTRSATFDFASDEVGSTFECSIDGGAFSACTSPRTYNSLDDGAHRFEVRATDTAGNLDSTPASWSWTIDATAPETTITSGPSGLTNQTTASFSFTSTETGSRFECALDGRSSPCSSPRTYVDLADGAHLFEVRAIDTAGNVDASAASWSWTVDATAPAAPTLVAPANGSSNTDTKPTFDWSDVSDASAVSYQIQIDNSGSEFPSPEVNQSGLSASAFTPANSLGAGTHNWRVRAVDAAGNSGVWSGSFTVTVTVPPGAIAGTVTSRTTKKGLSGATVDCGTAGTATTASNGTYSMPNVAPATYSCTASASGHKSLTKSVKVTSNATTTADFALRKS